MHITTLKVKIKLIYIGKTSKKFLVEGEEEYFGRLKHYCSMERIGLPDIKNQKNLTFEEIRKAEGEKFMAQLGKTDTVFLLDDKGKQYSSPELADFIQKQLNYNSGNLVFIIGGAFGFSNELYALANGKISLSSLTFSHQMVRMIFL